MPSETAVAISKIKDGDFCLIHAASSGIGTALMQLINSKKDSIYRNDILSFKIYLFGNIKQYDSAVYISKELKIMG